MGKKPGTLSQASPEPGHTLELKARALRSSRLDQWHVGQNGPKPQDVSACPLLLEEAWPDRPRGCTVWWGGPGLGGGAQACTCLGLGGLACEMWTWLASVPAHMPVGAWTGGPVPSPWGRRPTHLLSFPGHRTRAPHAAAGRAGSG